MKLEYSELMIIRRTLEIAKEQDEKLLREFAPDSNEFKLTVEYLAEYNLLIDKIIQAGVV